MLSTCKLQIEVLRRRTRRGRRGMLYRLQDAKQIPANLKFNQTILNFKWTNTRDVLSVFFLIKKKNSWTGRHQPVRDNRLRTPAQTCKMRHSRKKNGLGIGCLYQERLFLSCATKQKPTKTGEKPPSQATVACRNQIWSTAHAVASFMPKSAGQAYVDASLRIQTWPSCGAPGHGKRKRVFIDNLSFAGKTGTGIFVCVCVSASPHTLCV